MLASTNPPSTERNPMARFVHLDSPQQHPGVARVEEAVGTVQSLKNRLLDWDGARGAATLLLLVVVSALLVVASQVVETWTEGHLLAAWLVMWVVVFAATALLTMPARRLGVALRASAKAWAENRARNAEDERTWQVALKDPRIMAELNHAMGIPTVSDIRRYY